MGQAASPRGTDHGGVASVGGEPDELRVQSPDEGIDGLLQVSSGGPNRHDPLPVRRPGELLVVRRRRGQGGCATALGGHPPDVSLARVVVPGHVGDPLAVGRPDGLELAHLVVGQAPGVGGAGGGVVGGVAGCAGAVGQLRDVEPVQGGEGDLRAVRRDPRVADLLDGEDGRVLDRVLELDLGPDGDLHIRRERYLGRLRAVHGDPPDPPAVGEDQRFGVRREGVSREHVHVGGGLLVVPLHGVGEPSLLARGQLPEADAGVGVVAGPVRQQPAVGGERRAEGRAVAVAHRRAGARLPVVDPELVLGEDRVVLPRSRPLGVPDVATVRADGGSHQPLPEGGERDRLAGDEAGATHHLQASAAVHMVEPELLQAEAGQRPRHHHVLPVGHPLGREEAAADPLAELGRLAARRRHEPDVVVATSVGHEDEPFAVGAEAGLHVVGQAAGEAGRLAPLDRDRVEVPQQVEGDRAPVGAHVQGDPGALAGREAGPARGLQRESPVRVRLLLGGVLGVSGLRVDGWRIDAQRLDGQRCEEEQRGRRGTAVPEAHSPTPCVVVEVGGPDNSSVGNGPSATGGGRCGVLPR